MVNGRAFHSAAVLKNGAILLVGGANQNGERQKTAEIFDPATGTFSATMPPHFGYFSAPAVTLDDGSVLLNDGRGDAELFDPISASFINTGTPTYSPSALFTMTLLTDHEVLIAGGFLNRPGHPATPDTELYNPAAKKFAIFDSLREPRDAHTATLLPDGSVLVAGGEGNFAATLSSAERLPLSALPLVKAASKNPGRRPSVQDRDHTSWVGRHRRSTSGDRSAQRAMAESLLRHESQTRALASQTDQ